MTGIRLTVLFLLVAATSLRAQIYPIPPEQIRQDFGKTDDVVKPAYRNCFYPKWSDSHGPSEELRVGLPVFTCDFRPIFTTYYETGPSYRMYQLSFATFHGGHWSHAQFELKAGANPEVKVMHERFIKLTNQYDTLINDSASGTKKDTATFTRYIVMDGDQLLHLEDMDSAGLVVSRNWILARHGCRFKSKELNDYFFRYRWWVPKFDRVDPLLTKEDKDLIALLSKFEAKRKESK